ANGGSCVDPAERRDSAVAQPLQPDSLCSGRVLPVLALAHDHAAGLDALGLHRVAGDAVVADQRVGEGDDLPGVGGIGDRLLVAGHRGVEDDLAGDVAARAEQLAVEPGAVLEQDVAAHVTVSLALGMAPGFGAYSRISFWTVLNSSVPARPSSSKSAVSTLVTTAPARSILCRPIRLFSSVRDPTASSATWTSAPSSRRSRTVWLTQTWVSMPQTSAWSRPSRSKPSASAAEKTTFSSGRVPSGRCFATSGAVLPRPLGYCSETMIGIPIASAPSISVAAAFATRSKSRIAFRNPS